MTACLAHWKLRIDCRVGGHSPVLPVIFIVLLSATRISHPGSLLQYSQSVPSRQNLSRSAEKSIEIYSKLQSFDLSTHHSMSLQHRTSRIFWRASVVTFLMIIIGAITRTTESGMGCGTYWPDCNGHLIPQLQSTAEVIEVGHRVFALLVGGYAIAVVRRAWISHRHTPGIMLPAVMGILLFILQSALGAWTVRLSNQWLSVLLHLGNAMLLLATFLIGWANARFGEQYTTVSVPHHSVSALPLTIPFILTVFLAFTVALSGAAVAGNNAAKACIGYPLCNGQLLPISQGPLQVMHMSHRLVVGALGVMLVSLLWSTRRNGDDQGNRVLRYSIRICFGLYLLQAALGASIVLIGSREWLVAVKALHVTFASATWSALVVASVVVWLQASQVQPKLSPLPAG